MTGTSFVPIEPAADVPVGPAPEPLPDPMTQTAESTAAPQSVLQPARGKVLKAGPGVVVFKPRGTNYELHLETAEPFQGPLNKPVDGFVRVQARKVYTVPSGGLFIEPLTGRPRTVQGRVVAVGKHEIAIHVGGIVIVSLPEEPHAIDLGSGPIAEGVMVNVVAFPGASFELSRGRAE